MTPPAWSWFNGTNQTYDPSAGADPANVAYADKNGFFIIDAFWGAFPEPIESMFYAWRLTGDNVWQDYAWEAFEHMINDTQRYPNETFAQLTDVTQPLGGALNDYVPR
jgi:mannosyl-oligosaccharide alpha-1,2-mannosidase